MKSIKNINNSLDIYDNDLNPRYVVSRIIMIVFIFNYLICEKNNRKGMFHKNIRKLYNLKAKTILFPLLVSKKMC